MQAETLWEDMKFYTGNLKEFMTKIDKITLVTDNSWIKNLSETSYKFIPGIELKSYKFDKRNGKAMGGKVKLKSLELIENCISFNLMKFRDL